ncbi:hypothetical protein Ancab_007874 [Ancistrocladus abbreviatus]
MLLCLTDFSNGYTNPEDVAAINSLYAAFAYPTLPGWVPNGGDPCSEAWQGVQCDISNIISIILVGANLGGGLGDNLGSFSAIKSIDLSNNHIGGSIPSSLPSTMQNLFLSDNNLTGSIPSSISSLTQLSALKLNDNHLSGEIPDAFGSLLSLASLDLANNNLSGKLPPSMENLSSLTSLHLQANQLSGTLNVLEDLPLQDLDIRNNQFSGPIPEKLLSIPNFQKDGNPFNTSASPESSPTSPPTRPSPPTQPSPLTPKAPSQAPPRTSTSPTGRKPDTQAPAPSSREEHGSGSKKNSTVKRVVWISIVSVIAFIIFVLALLLLMPACISRSRKLYQTSRDGVEPYKGATENPPALVPRNNQTEKVQKDAGLPPKSEVQPEIKTIAAVPRLQNEQNLHGQGMRPLRKQDTAKSSLKSPSPLTSVRSFTIASLQQYTSSFSQDNLIGSGMLGSVYRAELPDGKLLAVKKLDKGVCSRLNDHEFIQIVNSIDRIRHANIVGLVGYCAEYGQRLLIHEFCSDGSLQDSLHSDGEYKKQLSWNMRMKMAVGAARALEYLHEVCEPPVVHRNFKSANILLDDELNVRVSDCGLAPLIASGSVSQLPGHFLSTYGYGAPEFESGIYTSKSDVYSFGVVMLELLTGRLSYDSTRTRAEQLLVRWAVPQLHDIGALFRMVDPSLNGEYPTKSLSHFADIISRCVLSEPEFRPLMSEVVQDLRRMLQRGSPTKSSYGD